jgi:DNA-binding NarL/FixJ family response regulator
VRSPVLAGAGNASWTRPRYDDVETLEDAMRILVVDDHPLMVDAIRLALLTLDRSAEIQTAADLPAALAATGEGNAFDLVLLDLGLPGCTGLEALGRFREERPEQAVVVVSGSSGRELILDALDRGAMGFIPKTSPPDVLRQAVRLITSGGIFIPIEAVKSAGQAATPPVAHVAPNGNPSASPGLTPRDLGLTPRQGDVLALLLKGLPNKLIARKLDISENTAKVHVAAVLHALRVSTRTQALIEATRLGLRLGG